MLFVHFVLAGVSTLEFNGPISGSNGSRTFPQPRVTHSSYPNRYWGISKNDHPRVNVRFETPRTLRRFQTLALIMRVSEEALRQNMSHVGDCSKPTAGKCFGDHVWQLTMPFPPPSFQPEPRCSWD